MPFGDTLQSWQVRVEQAATAWSIFPLGSCWRIRSAGSFFSDKGEGFWGTTFHDVTLAFSAVYEIIEWLAAANVDPAAGLAFLGSQGDVWDAQDIPGRIRPCWRWS